MKIEIVSHCFSHPDVPVYHKLLAYQLAAIVNQPPTRCEVAVTVCALGVDDRYTLGVLEHFDGLLDLNIMAIPREQLFRRAIGRNIAAKSTDADLVIFTDCDYVWTREALDWLANMWAAASMMMPVLTYPQIVNIHRTHDIGDAYVARVTTPLDPAALMLNDADFLPRRESNAWGGMFVVRGDYCREHGYLDGTKWVEPVPNATHFKQCKCDVPFRKACPTKAPLDIPGVYRLRHTRAGRDEGQKDHGTQTREAPF